MSAIPKGLVSRENLKQMSGINCYRTTVLPSNSSGTYSYEPSGNNRVIFDIPAFENSFINTKRSYIRFQLFALGTAREQAVLCPGAPIFRRLLLKGNKGQVLEDIDSYDVLCRIMNNFKTAEELDSKQYLIKDTRLNTIDTTTDWSKGQNVIHELNSGLLGKVQEFLVPVSALNASQGNAFRLELWLNDVAKLFPNTKHATDINVSYKIEEVAFEMELVEVSPEIMSDINRELANGSQIALPYKSWRSHTSHMSGGQTFKANISESAHNVEAVFSVMYPQTAGSIIAPVVNSTKINATSKDPYRFTGGRFKIDETNTPAANDQIVQKYSYRYGAKYYPLAPVNLDKDSVVALENIVSGFELDEKMPFMASNTDGKTFAHFESDCFMIAQNFKTTNDNLYNGLNSSSTGSPIELNLEFKNSLVSGTTGDLEIQSFIQSTNVLYIQQNGQASLVKN